MAFNGRGPQPNLKLPSISALGLSTRCEVPVKQQLHTNLAYSDPGIRSVNSAVINSSRGGQRNTDHDFMKITPEHEHSFHRIPSPESEFRLSKRDVGHSTEKNSPYSGSSQARSRSSSSTGRPFARQENSNNAARIGSVSFNDAYNRLDQILVSCQKTSTPRARNEADAGSEGEPESEISSSRRQKEKHKNKEKDRRGMHKQLRELAKDLCEDVLDQFQNSNIDRHKEDLVSQLVRAMKTGNHKKHFTTKVAIQLAQIVLLLDQKRHIQTLECILQNAGISLPEIGETISLASPTNKRRKSYF